MANKELYKDTLQELEFEIDLLVVLRRKVIMNRNVAELLREIDAKGSILAACRALRMPYSRAWESIARLERALGKKIIEPVRGGRGGGGTKLTELGRALVEEYFRRYPIAVKDKGGVSSRVRLPELMIAGSHDPLLENALGLFKAKNALTDVEVSWIGSAGGLSALMLGEADIAGVHLYDPETGEYNVPFLKRYWLSDKAVIVRGYARELVLAYSPNVELRGFEDVLLGRVKIVNRVLGSGTRVIFDVLLTREAAKLGLHPRDIKRNVRGYNDEVMTHYDVARHIVEGRADAGLTLRFIADLYGLHYKHVCWEKYDFAIRMDRFERAAVKAFVDFLKTDIKEIINKYKGYKADKNTGEIIYSPYG